MQNHFVASAMRLSEQLAHTSFMHWSDPPALASRDSPWWNHSKSVLHIVCIIRNGNLLSEPRSSLMYILRQTHSLCKTPRCTSPNANWPAAAVCRPDSLTSKRCICYTTSYFCGGHVIWYSYTTGWAMRHALSDAFGIMPPGAAVQICGHATCSVTAAGQLKTSDHSHQGLHIPSRCPRRVLGGLHAGCYCLG